MPIRLFVGYAEECVVVGVGVFRVYVGCGDLSAFVLGIICSHGFCRNFSDVPPDAFGCAEGWSCAHCCFACLINDSLCSQSFCAAFALSAALNDSWW
jgi:hypothetical protein